MMKTPISRQPTSINDRTGYGMTLAWTLYGVVWMAAGVLMTPLSADGQQTMIRVETTDEQTRWGSYGPGDTTEPDFIIDEPLATPEWALLQRELLRSASLAAEHYYERYFDEKGYLKTDLRWGANDGPDDAIENVNRWPELYALGGSDKVLEMYKKVYEGHVQQMSDPELSRTVTGRTSHLPYIVDGMYYKEFLSQADWMHISEALIVFNKMGLNDPYDVRFRNRTRRFAEFYTGDDPGAPNYDPEHKIIRSMYNGSRGPLMRLTTGVDWTGDPSEVRNRYAAGHGEENYEEFLFHFKDYHDTVGDVPLNLISTNLAVNAYMLTGEDKYRDWLLEYVDAWYDRMEANQWVIPSLIGLDGTIGGESGKWYAGAYGWGFTVDHQTPPAHTLTNRPRWSWAFIGFMNAYKITGDDRYLEAWRKQDEVIYEAGYMRDDGVYVTPRMYGDPGWSLEGYTDDPDWYDFQPRDNRNLLEIYYLSMKPEDRRRITATMPWLDYLEGNHPDYAVNAMRADVEDVKKRMRLMREDQTSMDMRLADDPMSINPVSVVSLVRLMGGGLHEARRSSPLYTRLRYFDADRRRAGVPEDVAALVETMNDQSVTVSVVNLNPVEARSLVIQGGGYAEHQLLAVRHNGVSTPIDRTSFQVLLEPGSGATLEIEMDRYVNQPTMDFPWFRDY